MKINVVFFIIFAAKIFVIIIKQKSRFNRIMLKKSLLLVLTFCVSLPIFAQSESGNVRKGNKLYHKELYEQAQTEFQKGADKNEKSFAANYNLGNAFYRQQKFPEAINAYIKAISETDNKNKKAMAFHNIGNALLESGQYAQSVQAYKESLKLNPTDHETRYNLAVAQHFLKQQQQQNKNDNKKDDQKQDDQQQQLQPQPQPQQPNMTKEQAEQILQVLQQDEKDTQDKKKIKVVQKGKAEKEW